MCPGSVCTQQEPVTFVAAFRYESTRDGPAAAAAAAACMCNTATLDCDIHLLWAPSWLTAPYRVLLLQTDAMLQSINTLLLLHSTVVTRLIFVLSKPLCCMLVLAPGRLCIRTPCSQQSRTPHNHKPCYCCPSPASVSVFCSMLSCSCCW